MACKHSNYDTAFRAFHANTDYFLQSGVFFIIFGLSLTGRFLIFPQHTNKWAGITHMGGGGGERRKVHKA
jgi:hypothetical protein